MTFRDTQLGRFHEVCRQTYGSKHGDPDLLAANSLAADGVGVGQRPDLSAVLGQKLLSDDSDPNWKAWEQQFGNLRGGYMKRGGGLLVGQCPKPWDGMPSGFCMHELTPPNQYFSLRSFDSRMLLPFDPDPTDPATKKLDPVTKKPKRRVTNLLTKQDGSIAVDESVKPIWNYVITLRGEVLVAPEDYGWIKHTSIAGGSDVWSAGQVGLEGGKLRLLDLQSGHYVLGGKANIVPGTPLALELVKFTRDVIHAYFAHFQLKNLHPSFDCIW